MEDRKKYIHYGHSRFDKERFVTPRNWECFTKPFGGLWASPIDAEWGWKDWCKTENFHLDRLKKSFTFSLRDGAKVAHICDADYLRSLPHMECRLSWVCLDFERLVDEGYDAVELHLSEEKPHGFMDGLYYALYGWDCDSILILNPDVVIPEKPCDSNIT